MTPQFASRIRGITGTLLFVVALSLFGAAFYILDSRTENEPEVEVIKPDPQQPDEWLYVTTNSVLLFPVVSDKCRPKNALMQVHRGTKVLVIARHGEWVEIEQEDQTALATHGCIHESMLEKKDD